MADRLLAEFPSDDAAASAIRLLRQRGFTELDVYAPFPSHAVEDALEPRRSRLPFAVFVAGLCGAGGAYLLQWLLVAKLYPLVVGMRPPHSPLAFVIITFEMGVLLAGVTAVISILVLGRLVRLLDAVQGTPGFESVTRDRFWVEVLRRDTTFDDETTPQLLRDLGATRVEAAG